MKIYILRGKRPSAMGIIHISDCPFEWNQRENEWLYSESSVDFRIYAENSNKEIYSYLFSLLPRVESPVELDI